MGFAALNPSYGSADLPLRVPLEHHLARDLAGNRIAGHAAGVTRRAHIEADHIALEPAALDRDALAVGGQRAGEPLEFLPQFQFAVIGLPEAGDARGHDIE